jgi:iron complex outermembrane recepter protein
LSLSIRLLFAVSLFPLAAWGQRECSFSISGRIADAETNEILASANVRIVEVNKSMMSDKEGRFVIQSLCAGQYTLRCSFVGYKTISTTITIIKNSITDFLLVRENSQLEEVIVRDKLSNIEGSQNFVTLNEKQLVESAGKTLGETLKEIPGVSSIQSGPGIFKPVIHGVHSQRVLILNHGIRQEGQQWGAEHAPEIDPFIASNVVVIKDASAIKYGTDALGGVVVVNPPDLPSKSDLGGSVSAVAQSNGRSGTISATLEGGVKKHEGWGWRVQGTAKRAGDFKTPTYYLTNTGIKEVDFSVATGYHAKKYGAEIFFSHFETQLGILKGTSISNLNDLVAAMERVSPQYTSGFSYSISEPRQEVSHNLLKWNGHIKTNKGEWRMQYGFQNNNRREFDIRVGAALSKIPSIDLQLNTHTLETEYEIGTNRNNTFCAGATAMYQANSNVPGTQRIPFIPNFTTASGGAFAISKLQFNKWVVDVGARYDYRTYHVTGYDFKNTLYKDFLIFHNPSATVGATHAIDKKQWVSSNVSSAWRPPHVAELYSLGTHQSAAAIEYGLLLNDSTNEVMNFKTVPFKIENALKWVNTYHYQVENFQVEATAYVNYIFNYIYLKPTGITQNVRGTYPYLRYTQTDASFVGIDFSGSWQASKQVKFSSKLSLLSAADQSNHDYLVYIPSNRYELAIRFDEPTRIGLKSFFFETKIKYIAQQQRAPRVVTVREIKESREMGVNLFADNATNFDFMAAPAGYYLWNAATGFSISKTTVRYDFRVAAENILNTTYREYTNRFRYYANDLGQNFIVSLKCIF